MYSEREHYNASQPYFLLTTRFMRFHSSSVTGKLTTVTGRNPPLLPIESFISYSPIPHKTPHYDLNDFLSRPESSHLEILHLNGTQRVASCMCDNGSRVLNIAGCYGFPPSMKDMYVWYVRYEYHSQCP